MPSWNRSACARRVRAGRTRRRRAQGSRGPRYPGFLPGKSSLRPAARKGVRASQRLRLAAAAAPAEMLREDGRSLYVHLPFCTSKCRYCDFNSYAWSGQSLERHVRAVLAEARARAAGLRPQTVFIGGGTPSFLPAPLLGELLQQLDEVTGFRASASEVTMEANPESFDDARAAAAAAGGVNRVSIGVQSLRAPVLRAYDRVHSAETALAALRRARALFARVNADLIYAFPGQDPQEWQEDLESVLALGVDHVSCYELSFEPGTALTRMRDAGRFRAEEPERGRALFERTRALCARHGFGQYEVSNYARAGAACRHNLAYWRSLDYVGIGAGAASWLDGERRKNLELPEAYEQAVRAGKDPVAEAERTDPATTLFDALMMGLRLPAEGVLLERARRISGLDPAAACGATLDELIGEGLLELTPGPARRLRATDSGLPFLDSILTRLLAVLRP